jgi:hypothetical protein
MAFRNRRSESDAGSSPPLAPMHDAVESGPSGRSVVLETEAMIAVPGADKFRQVAVRTQRLSGDRITIVEPAALLPPFAVAVVTIALPTGRVCLLGELVGTDQPGHEPGTRIVALVETANDLVLTFLAGRRT